MIKFLKTSSLLFAIAATLFTVWFLCDVATWQGWVIGIWGLAVAWSPFALSSSLRKNESVEVASQASDVVSDQVKPGSANTRSKFALVFLLVAFLVSTTVLIRQTPLRQSLSSAAISNQYAVLNGDVAEPPWRYSLSNMVPEKEQISLEFRLMPFVDPFFTSQQANVVSQPTFELYDELDSDANFRSLGCVLGSGYADLGRRPYLDGHYYFYVPKTANSKKPRPAIVFLHGSGGNFKPYIWLWSQVAEKQGYVIIAPTFGFGNWRREEGLEVVRAALNDAKSKTDIDETRIFLAGLSNGGLGVSHVGSKDAEQYKGLIYISPVMDDRYLESEEYIRGWKGRPQLFITGETDKRVPFQYVQKRVSVVKANQADVTFRSYENQDHFLFFAKPGEVFKDIESWLQTASPTN